MNEGQNKQTVTLLVNDPCALLDARYRLQDALTALMLRGAKQELTPEVQSAITNLFDCFQDWFGLVNQALWVDPETSKTIQLHDCVSDHTNS